MCIRDRYYHYRVEASADGESWFPVGEKLDNALSTEKGDELSLIHISEPTRPY